MAGRCVGLGLTTDDQGRVAVLGARQVEWPNEGSCPIAANNGLRVDPVSGALWVPPDGRLIRERAVGGTDGTFVPTVAGSYLLTELVLEMDAPACADAQMVVVVNGGFIGQRMGNGNWWAVQRYLTIYLDDVVVGFTGNQTVASLENNSGGVLSSSGPVDPVVVTLDVPAGSTGKVLAHYEHNRLAFTASAANGYDWRCPVLDGLMFTLEP